MGKRRATRNAKDRRRAQPAPAVPAPAEVFQRRLDLRRRLTPVMLDLLGVVLLSISFAPFDAWPAAYVALVPWAMSLAGSRPGRWAVLCAWGGGLLFALLNLYWLTWITLAGWAALAFYVSLYWLAAAVLVRRAITRNWPMWIVLPVVWVALEYLRATLISGFPWFLLAHTQYRLTRLIQIADLTGQFGVSFLVAMVNGALVDLLCSPLFVRSPGGGARVSRRMVVGAAASVLAAAGLLAYGQWRVSWPLQEEGPVVAVVQHAIPIALDQEAQPSEQIFENFLRSTEPLVGSGVDLVVWPETMLPRGLNAEVLASQPASMDHARLRAMGRHLLGPDAMDPKYSDQDIRDALERVIHGNDPRYRLEHPSLWDYARAVAAMTERLGCPLLAGGAAVVPRESPLYPDDFYVHRNSALWFDRQPMPLDRYDKVKLVPFGEYVPFKYGWPALHRFLRSFVPEVMDQLDPGRQDQVFTLARGDRSWRLVTPICYEGVFAPRCRELVMRGGRKAADLTVNISNDGWFIHQRQGRSARASTELTQHLAQYCFRAVETRTPVVRAVNTGVSAYIDSNGAIRAVVRQWAGGRWQQGMAVGTLVLDGRRDSSGQWAQGHGPKLLVDRRISRYSLRGDVFALLVCAAAAGMLLALLPARWLLLLGRKGLRENDERQ